jgi:undecaprenyl diphosphate synthase
LKGGFFRRAASVGRFALRLVSPKGGHRQAEDEMPDKLPRHVAIIMDGNGRWARRQGLPRTAGHYAGAEALRAIIQACDDLRIEALSIYAFSTENWARPEDEVSALMALMLKLFESEIDELHRKGARIRVLGDIEGLPGPQRDIVLKTMARTKDNEGLKLNVAINYGGRQEILSAAKRVAKEITDIDALSAADFERALYTAGLPDVDLLIRTSGEMRISNFLLWQSAYAEVIFNPVYWPDYTRAVFLKDLREYAARDRRFGKV